MVPQSIHSFNNCVKTTWQFCNGVWEWIQDKRHFMLNISECSLKGAICNLSAAKCGVISGEVVVTVTGHKLWQNCCLQYKRFWVTVSYEKVCGVSWIACKLLRTNRSKRNKSCRWMPADVARLLWRIVCVCSHWKYLSCAPAYYSLPVNPFIYFCQKDRNAKKSLRNFFTGICQNDENM